MNNQARNRYTRLLSLGGVLAVLAFTVTCSTLTVHTNNTTPTYGGPGQRDYRDSYFKPVAAKAKKTPVKSEAKHDPKTCPHPHQKGVNGAITHKPLGNDSKSARKKKANPSLKATGATMPGETRGTAMDSPVENKEDSYFAQLNDEKKNKKEAGKQKDEKLISRAPEKKDTREKNSDGTKFVAAGGGDDFYEVGTASWYGGKFNGRKTASGEIFNSRKLTAAHKKLPLGTILLVRNMENDREVLVRVNDRGPFIKGRILDLSEYAAERLNFKERGLTTVGIRIIRPGDVTSKGDGATFKDFGHRDDKSGKDITVGKSGKERKAGEKSSYFPSLFQREAQEPPAKKGTNTNTKESDKKIRVTKKKYLEEEPLNYYTIQAGVFQNSYNAEGLKYKLREFKQAIQIVKRERLFILKVGNFQSREEALGMLDQLIAAGFPGFVLTPRAE